MLSSRERKVASNRRGHSGRRRASEITSNNPVSSTGSRRHIRNLLDSSATDILVALGFIFGGCCVNVWSFEELLRSSHGIGTAITFCQMLFISCQAAPQVLDIKFHPAGKRVTINVKSRQVPLRKWILQVLVLLGGTLLNNWSFAYNVPLAMQIVIRSSGLPVSMLLGHIILKKNYSTKQVVSVGFVTLGVLLATTSKTIDRGTSGAADAYVFGVFMLLMSLIFTGLLGILQEITYRQYGPCWQESLFYTHVMSLPVFIFLLGDVFKGFEAILSLPAEGNISYKQLLVLAINVFTQLLCVTGVNRMSAHVTSVTKNVVLTARKAVSLCLSVWLFQTGWNPQLLVGASMVFSGSIAYAANTVEM